MIASISDGRERLIRQRLDASGVDYSQEDVVAIDRLRLSEIPSLDRAIDRWFSQSACQALSAYAERRRTRDARQLAAEARAKFDSAFDIANSLEAALMLDPRGDNAVHRAVYYHLERLRGWLRDEQYLSKRPSAVYTFAWAPAIGGNLGAIALRLPPESTLTASDYWLALAERLDRLIDNEDSQRARSLLKAVERLDRNVIFNDLRDAGLAIVQSSQWLRAKVLFPGQALPSVLVRHRQSLLDDMLSEDETLERYLRWLYGPPSLHAVRIRNRVQGLGGG